MIMERQTNRDQLPLSYHSGGTLYHACQKPVRQDASLRERVEIEMEQEFYLEWMVCRTFLTWLT